MKFDPLEIVDKVPFKPLKNKALDLMLTFGIPFNIGMGLKVLEINRRVVRVESPPRWKRKNHLGSAHAVALALLAEYPAGIMVVQQFPFKRYRLILGNLQIEYHKQGHGKLISETRAPSHWPEPTAEGESWIELETKITNEKNELVALAKTKWQVKLWEKVRKPKT